MNDAELLERFESCRLVKEDWTHRNHVKVAFLLLRRWSFDDALKRMRQGIQALNAAHGVEESATSGYNETTTQAFLQLIWATMESYGRTHPASDAESFCTTHSQLLCKHVLRLFYSPERRMHPLAKTHFIEPDLAPLPKPRRVT